VNIQELPLCVKGEVSTTYVVFGFGYGGGGLVRAVKGMEGYLYSENRFKIRRHSPQWDNLDLCTDNHHRAVPENLNNLRGQLVVTTGPLVGVFA
jgi:hypothetical protein